MDPDIQRDIMPKEFEDMVDHILENLRKEHPNETYQKLRSMAYAIATNNWKASHNGELP